MSKFSSHKKELEKRHQERVKTGQLTPFEKTTPGINAKSGIKPADAPRFSNWLPADESQHVRFWASPRVGDIVHCKFPDFLKDLIPLSERKSRPALIVGVETTASGASYVQVAYGTSQTRDDKDRHGNTVKGHGVDAGELFVPASDVKCGLNMDTKFSFRKVVKLPFDTIWFRPFPGQTNGIHPKRGFYDVESPHHRPYVQQAINDARRLGSELDGDGPDAKLKAFRR